MICNQSTCAIAKQSLIIRMIVAAIVIVVVVIIIVNVVRGNCRTAIVYGG
jgi:hypothetical protein